MRTKIYRSALILMLFPLLVSCNSANKVKEFAKKTKAQIHSLNPVLNQVGKKVGDGYINVTISNDRFLTVAITNSKLNDLDADHRKANARQIARVAYQAYESRAQLEKVSVSFGISKSYLSIFHYHQTTDSYGFKASDLKAHPKPAHARPTNS